MKIEKIPIKDWSVIEAIAAIIPALNQVIDHLNQAETTPEEGKEISKFPDGMECGHSGCDGTICMKCGLHSKVLTNQSLDIVCECPASQKEQTTPEEGKEPEFIPLPKEYLQKFHYDIKIPHCECPHCHASQKEQASKNEKLLKEFTEYCRKYPDQRFWQALRNWSGAQNIIWEDEVIRQDTFYWEGKDRNS